MKKLGSLAVAALLALGCAEAPKTAPPPPAVDPAKMMEGSTPAAAEPTPAAPAEPAATPTTPADPAATPAEAPKEAEPTPAPEKKE